MAKDTFYFSHDYNPRADEKIKLLIRRHGILGYGIFWAIIEDLYNNANALRTDYEGIAFDLRVDTNIVKSVINDFDLFIIKDDFFGSLSVQRRLDDRNAKSKKASNSANYRWNKSKDDANAMRTQCDGNAIKERKVKEIKEIKEIDSGKSKRFSPPTLLEVENYCFERKNTVDASKFIDYYTSNGWKVGKNSMKDWRAAVRTWEKSQNNNNNGNKQKNRLDADAKWRAEIEASIARDYADLHK